MLSRNLKRVLLDSRWPIPPPFLLPWTASLTTVAHTTDPIPPQLPASRRGIDRPRTRPHGSDLNGTSQSTPQQMQPPKPLPSPTSPSFSTATPLDLSSSVRDLLPLLQAQAPHYITLHIHGKPYLVTQGDVVRLPFHMHGVEPGDVLRLNRAINIGSRDYTLKAAAGAPKFKSPTMDTRNVLDPTTGTSASHSQTMPSLSPDTEVTPAPSAVQLAPHYVPHIEKGKHGYLDERLFVCRAVVMGVESEPLRIKEKTKRRQRKVKKVKSKHRFTILRIKEVSVRSAEELAGLGEE